MSEKRVFIIQGPRPHPGRGVHGHLPADRLPLAAGAGARHLRVGLGRLSELRPDLRSAPGRARLEGRGDP